MLQRVGHSTCRRVAGLCVGDSAVGLGLGLGLAHSCMYCDQPSLLTRDPGGGVNEEIPHRWAKQPARLINTHSTHTHTHSSPVGRINASGIE